MAPADRLSNRILPGLVLALVALGSIYLGGIAYLVLCGLLASAMSWEWVCLVRCEKPGLQRWPIAAAVCTGCVTLVTGLSSGFLEYPLYAALVLAAVFAGISGVNGRGRGSPSLRFVWLAGAVIWPSIFLVAATFIRQSEDGLATSVWLCAVVWGTDVGAYLVGRVIGGPRLAPRLSPGKTWAGVVGGLVIGTIAAGLTGWGCTSLGWTGSDVAIGLVCFFALLFSIISQAGDLLESATKRYFGVKNTGTLIPGHGGVMDRLDSLSVATTALGCAMYLSSLGPLNWGVG